MKLAKEVRLRPAEFLSEDELATFNKMLSAGLKLEVTPDGYVEFVGNGPEPSDSEKTILDKVADAFVSKVKQ